MKKKKGWQTALIIAVIGLTLYNILPTIFFYTKPLNRAVDAKEADATIRSAMKRVNSLEDDTHAWIQSLGKLLHIKIKKIDTSNISPQLVSVTLANSDDAEKLKKVLPRAGSLIPFYPSQLSLYDETTETNTVVLQRKIPIKFDLQEANTYFTFAKMYDSTGTPTQAYKDLILDRILALGLSMGGPTENAALVDLVLKQRQDPRADDFLYMIAQNLLNIEKIFASDPTLAKPFYASFTQGPFENKHLAVRNLIDVMTGYKDRVQLKKVALKDKEKNLQKEDLFLETSDLAELNSLTQKEENLLKAITLLKKEEKVVSSGKTPWQAATIRELYKANPNEFVVGDQNPLIQSLTYDLAEGSLTLHLKPSIQKLKENLRVQPERKSQYEALNQLIFAEIAKISRDASETFTPIHDEFVLNLKSLPNSSSFITFDLAKVAKAEFDFIKKAVQEEWKPNSEDLKRESYPIVEWSEYEKLPALQRHLQLILYSPLLSPRNPLPGFKENSIYFIAKDLGKIFKKFEQSSNSNEASALSKDFQSLTNILRRNGFIGYPGTTFPLSSEFKDDYIFESTDFYLPVLQATREKFKVQGTKRFAILELSDVRENILNRNRIETEIHESLLKWRDDYNAAQVDLSLQAKFDVPKPTKNVYWNNFLLSLKKYFRGDERKVLKWGLDLSGGKTVQIALKDMNNKPVVGDEAIKQGINELYSRVNKMGVSDVNIRQEGNSITLDFPGSQMLSAADLIKASSMTFNIVNEKFSPHDAKLSAEVNQFLQEVWNEAVVTNKKDIESINLIAWTHLYGNALDPNQAEPRTESARILFENGLRLPNPEHPVVSNAFDDSISKIAIYRGDNFSDWYGQTHPLLIVFNNFAIEGSNLENVHAGYDPSKGNFLSFGVKSSQTTTQGHKSSPRKDLYAWTSVFAKERIMGTPYEVYTRGKGWRMAVILNGYVVSAPHLDAPLKDSGMISGHFTQREIGRLVTDLKAGSLSFTPQILSERSVSPELGMKERMQGITATVVALIAIVALMIGYYRFGGFIASIAVFFNIIIIWAALQNIGASITLANIAGIILTVGMAVDANVLVFERIREEFAKTQKLAVAVNAGYKKAFSAILDSNLTTIIAALILLHFDSGPIKGFAIALIIGIVSSMFTALFMTRYFFSRWVQNPEHKTLNMANLIKPRNWDFVKYGPLGLAVSALIIVAGGAAFYMQKTTILGMDFTGGYSVNIEVEKKEGANYRTLVETVLQKAGIASGDMQVRELVPDNNLRIFLSKNLDKAGKPFYQMPVAIQKEDPRYAYEMNPRLTWLVQALDSSDLKLTQKSLSELDQNWKSLSGQMSDAMRNNAILGLGLALLCILFYITFRFEFTFAISATLGLAFDVLITVALLAILHATGVPVQIDLNTIAALMTIVGYSLNDTIIVFDRVREDAKQMRRSTFKEIVNHSINATLSRTLLTSGTTVLVLLALVILGGSTIFGFSLIMVIGVVIGTLSTFFISSTLLLIFQNRTAEQIPPVSASEI